MWLGVDVGGTFTDLVGAGEDGKLVFAKVPSVPADPSFGVFGAITRAGVSPGSVPGPDAGPGTGSGTGTDPARVARFAHGTTVATNALLERRGAVTALVTTEGFRDVIEIGRQDRPALYDLTRDRPPALVPPGLRFTVRERCGPDGVIVPLDESEVTRLAEELAAVEGLQAVAVCLLFSFSHPGHEERAAELLRRRLPGITVVTSAQVLPQVREYERFTTTVADAYLGPALSGYLTRLGAGSAGLGVPEPLVMQSSGGVAALADAASRAASCVLSGPAAGVVGAAYVGQLSGVDDLLTFDMGGTSTDVAVVRGGVPEITASSSVGGVPIMLPSVDVHSVSAGGGSLAWADSGGALRVGPTSAGADPGPACYGVGCDPTVTDADLVLGYLADGALLGGQMRLSRDAAWAALAALGARLGLTPLEAAAGVVAVADAQMARALRVVSVERGIDPRDLTLVAFGGAGGMHACALAEDLGVTRILVPEAAGVLSALGLAIGATRRDYVQAFFGRLGEVDPEPVFADLAVRAAADLPGATHRRYADCRYAGQSHELTVPADGPAGPVGSGGLAAAFAEEHRRRNGYVLDGEAVEFTAVRLVATVSGPRPRSDPDAVSGGGSVPTDPPVAGPSAGTVSSWDCPAYRQSAYLRCV
ncbi:MAG: hydantoinase/oxoprolinase family protein, partial [Kineosporiaceae bacterium]